MIPQREGAFLSALACKCLSLLVGPEQARWEGMRPKGTCGGNIETWALCWDNPHIMQAVGKRQGSVYPYFLNYALNSKTHFSNIKHGMFLDNSCDQFRCASRPSSGQTSASTWTMPDWDWLKSLWRHLISIRRYGYYVNWWDPALLPTKTKSSRRCTIPIPVFFSVAFWLICTLAAARWFAQVFITPDMVFGFTIGLRSWKPSYPVTVHCSICYFARQ